MRYRFRFAAAALAVCTTSFCAEVVEAPPWSDEPPQLSRLIEEGYVAELAHAPVVAATRYCAAARHGSLEAQYRLGRLYLGRSDAAGREQGRTALALAAQRGHEKSATLLGDQPLRSDHLPECLSSGSVELFALGEGGLEDPVPASVVERYLLGLPQHKLRYARLIQRLAPRFAVDSRLALAIARAESGFDPAAVSSRNAQGLMQLIPDTAERFGVRDTMDPEQNVRGGLAYLRWLLLRFEGNVALASAAYNAGEGAVERHGGVPPYAETQAYVRRILNFYRSSQHAWPAAARSAAPPQ